MAVACAAWRTLSKVKSSAMTARQPSVPNFIGLAFVVEATLPSRSMQPGEGGFGFFEVLHGVDRFPVGAGAEPIQAAVRGQAREQLVLVVADVGEAGEELGAQYVNASAQPVVQ